MLWVFCSLSVLSLKSKQNKTKNKPVSPCLIPTCFRVLLDSLIIKPSYLMLNFSVDANHESAVSLCYSKKESVVDRLPVQLFIFLLGSCLQNTWLRSSWTFSPGAEYILILSFFFLSLSISWLSSLLLQKICHMASLLGKLKTQMKRKVRLFSFCSLKLE